MRDLFNLLPSGGGRGGVDAILRLRPDLDVPFELKSTDGDSVSTARDVGREHIERWRQEHWLFGFFVRGANPPQARTFIYVSPLQMEPWIHEQETYVEADWVLAEKVPHLIGLQTLHEVLGDAERYSLDAAEGILKQQKITRGRNMAPDIEGLFHDTAEQTLKMTKTVYRSLVDRPSGFSATRLLQIRAELADPQNDWTLGVPDTVVPIGDACTALERKTLMHGGYITRRWLEERVDVPEGYSPERMLLMLRERSRYLLERGSTRNNPHITRERLESLVPADQIIEFGQGNFAITLTRLVQRALEHRADDTAHATR